MGASDASSRGSQRLSAVREQMRAFDLDYLWVPGTDPHFNEYVPPHWQRRQFVSGFTGSAGDALIGLQHAWVWTDSRYWLQAEQEVGSQEWTLMRSGAAQVPNVFAWLADQDGAPRVGIDARVVSIRAFSQWQEIDEAGQLVWLDDNPVDRVWHDRPALSQHCIDVFPLNRAGIATQEKLTDIRARLLEAKCNALVISELSAIAWLLNLRGDLISTTPFFAAYLMITRDDVNVYLDSHVLSTPAREQLAQQAVTIYSYSEFFVHVTQLDGPVWLDPNSTSVAVLQHLKGPLPYLDASPLLLPKACKNVAEQAGMREAHRLDGLALIKAFYSLHQRWQDLDEVGVAELLLEQRRQCAQFKGVSFETICGYADHGAVVHYQATPETAHALADDNCVLIDSGGQYDCGTTDVTRVWHFGSPTGNMRMHYTLVLKGHVAVSMARFAAGTGGDALDQLARAPLAAHGLNYGHGTGHGVGCYLSVHEGPQGLTPLNTLALQPGMVVSNEPGVYFDGAYGIRIENVLLVVEKDGQLAFETLTRVPYARNLIEVTELTDAERQWVDDYHRQIYQEYSSQLTDNERAWLFDLTRPL